MENQEEKEVLEITQAYKQGRISPKQMFERLLKKRNLLKVATFYAEAKGVENWTEEEQAEIKSLLFREEQRLYVDEKIREIRAILESVDIPDKSYTQIIVKAKFIGQCYQGNKLPGKYSMVEKL